MSWLLSYFSFEGSKASQGCNYNGLARGAIQMSNIYLNNAILELGIRAAGGPDNRIYGIKPASIISVLIALGGLLSAFVMPYAGALIDFTHHRKAVGIWSNVGITLITGIQMAIFESTFFAMAILQSIVYAMYQVEVLVVFAYFPEVGREVGEDKFNRWCSTWSFNQFLSQTIVNLIVLLCLTFAQFNGIKAAQLCQGVTFIFCAVFFGLCWYMMPNVPPKHKLREGQSLAVEGFRQNYNTAKKIASNYKTGLKWFLIATAFGEAGVTVIGTCVVIFLRIGLGMNALQIGIFTEVALVGIVAGTKLGAWVTRLTTPNVSLQLSYLGLFLLIAGGSLPIQQLEVKEFSYIWGFFIGVFLGWFYPTENVFFAFCVPSNQETELSGFFNWVSKILEWIPPIVFTIMIEKNINVGWAYTAAASFMVIAIVLLNLCGPWEKIIEEAQTVVIDWERPGAESRPEEADTATAENQHDGENHDSAEKDKDEELMA